MIDSENFIHNKFGYCYFDTSKEPNPIIFNLYINPEYRGNGYAEKILKQVICEIKCDGYTGQIDIEAKPREDIELKRLVSFYKRLNLNII